MGKAARNRAARQRAKQAEAERLRTDYTMPGDVEGHQFYWLSMRFTCGHALDYGVDIAKHEIQGQARLEQFLMTASAFPCVRCGSATGTPHDLPVNAAPTYLVANDVWYRPCPLEQQADATRNAEVAAAQRKATP